ncbi:MAG: HAD family hydrolase [bacterium]|nr:HAD family hydrolase [bacterium]
MRLEQQEFAPVVLEHVLSAIEAKLSTVNKRRIILTDLDYTLFSSYGFNPATNDHLPKIDPELIAAVRPHHLIAATGRRADNPTIPLLWESGLIPTDVPVIAENGGILVSQRHGTLEYLDLVHHHELGLLEEIQHELTDKLIGIPSGLKLVFKRGRTMLITRLQDDEGLTMPHCQEWLEENINSLISVPSMRVVNSRVSVTIQHKDINKRTAFQYYLSLQDIARDSIFVIGMGDGENDKEIFEEADLSLGFSDVVKSMVDIYVPHGAVVTPDILNRINKKTIQQQVASTRRIAYGSQ